MPLVSKLHMMTPEQAVELLMKFDALLPHGRPFLRPDEVAGVLNCTSQHIYDLVEAGALDVAVDVAGVDAKHMAMRISRYSMLLFLMRRTAL